MYVCMYVFYLKPNITTLIDMREYNFCRLDGSTHRVMREVTMHTYIHTFTHTYIQYSHCLNIFIYTYIHIYIKRFKQTNKHMH